MNPGIEDIQYYLPTSKLTNLEIIEKFDYDNSFLSDKLGVNNRHIAGNDESSSDLAINAAKKLIDENCIRKEDIGLLLLVTQNPDYKLPGTSHIVQDRIGLIDTCACFDVNLGCSGFVYALGIAKSMMQCHDISYCILITTDPYSKIISKTDRVTMPLFGDAATATLLSDAGDVKMLRFTFGSDGSGFRSLMVEGGGARYPFASDCEDSREASPNLFMDGRGIFNFIMKRVPEDIRKCLEINELRMEDIDFFVFHQASKYLLDHLVKRMKIPRELVVYHMEDIGNTVSSSIPIALSHVLKEDRTNTKKILISGFGVGLSWASTILTT